MDNLEFIKYMIEDYNSFFYSSNTIKYTVKDDSIYSISVGKDKDGNTHLNINSQISWSNVDNEIDRYKLLFILGHEICHYSFKHANRKKDKTSQKGLQEIKDLETWADFHGMIISLTILTYGEHSKTLFKEQTDINKRIENIFTVLNCDMYKIYKNEGIEYETANRRLQTVILGFISFLIRYDITNLKHSFPFNVVSNTNTLYQNKYLSSQSQWSHIIYTSCLRYTNIKNALLDKNNLDTEKNMQDALRIKEVHIKILNGHKYITDGIRNEYDWLIGTSFDRENIYQKSFQNIALRKNK